MGLDKLLNATKYSLAAGLVAGAVYAQDANAEFVDSVCFDRLDSISAGGFEDTSYVAPVGVQDCHTLENYLVNDARDALVVPLEGGVAYDFAVLRTDPDSSMGVVYSADNLPSFASFSATNGITELTPSCSDVGSYSVWYDTQSDFPIETVYDVSCSAGGEIVVEGLDFEGDGQVSGTPYHGLWADANNDGTIDQTVFVREGKLSPYAAWVVTDKSSVNVAARTGTSMPSYVNIVGDRIDIQPPDGFEGDVSQLELEVCDNAAPFACLNMDLTIEVVDRLPDIVGLSYTQENGAINNPNAGSFFLNTNEIDCTIPFIDSRYVVTRRYDPEQTYQIINEGPGMGINSSTGEVGINPDCQNVGDVYFPSVRVVSNSGSSTYVGGAWEITNGVTQQSVAPKKPDYR